MKYLCDRKNYQSTFYISAKYKNEGEGERTQKKVECEGERLRYEERMTQMSHDQINEPAVSSPKQTKSSVKRITIRWI